MGSDGIVANAGGKVAKEKAKLADAGVIVNGLLAALQKALGGLLNVEQADKAIAGARKQPAVKRLVATGKATKGGGAGGGGGHKAVRSTYQLFTTLAMAALKASHHEELAHLTLVGQTWNKLPPAVKARVEERLDGFREAYNERVADGGAGAPLEELARYEREQRLDPMDFGALVSRYKDAPTQPKAKPAAKGEAAPRGRPPKAALTVEAAPAKPAASGKRKGRGEEVAGGKKAKEPAAKKKK